MTRPDLVPDPYKTDRALLCDPTDPKTDPCGHRRLLKRAGDVPYGSIEAGCNMDRELTINYPERSSPSKRQFFIVLRFLDTMEAALTGNHVTGPRGAAEYQISRKC